MTGRIPLWAVLVTAVTVLASASADAAHYHAVSWTSGGLLSDLGTLSGGQDSWAYAVNNNGLVAGWSTDSSGSSRAVLWDSSGAVTDLGSGAAYGINGAGDVVGESDGRAVVWSVGGSITDLGPGVACDINENGQVTGFVLVPGQLGFAEPHAFVWSAEAGMTDLFKLTGMIGSRGWAINNLGWVAGTALVNEDWSEAAYWTPADGWTRVPGNRAFAVNDAGQIVSNTFYGAGLLWSSDAGLTELGQVSAYWINNAGVIGGQSWDGVPVLWTPDGGIASLAMPEGYTRGRVLGISDVGQAVGWSMYVPEPASVLTMLGGLALLALRRRG